MENEVTNATLIGELVNEHPETISVLTACGMHCLGCPASQAESLEEACLVHGLNPEKVLFAVNARIQYERNHRQ